MSKRKRSPGCPLGLWLTIPDAVVPPFPRGGQPATAGIASRRVG